MPMRMRRIEIVAQDPSVRRRNGRVLTSWINLPWEDLEDGPMGYALYVVDYDASTATMYKPPQIGPDAERIPAPTSMAALLADPGYHAVNVYAIVMRTLLRFEFALGRRVGWGIRGHQLKAVPHAFEEANAFYSPDAEALMFGYVRSVPRTFLCLSHDVVAHETAHALLDGLRDKFMAPSSSDQAALHEAFADVVALLSVFSLPDVVNHLLTPITDPAAPPGLVSKSLLTEESLASTALLGLADGMRSFAADVRVNALRRSVTIEPDRKILERAEFREEHRRGEVLVAAIMRALLAAWVDRIGRLGVGADGYVDRAIVAEQGADIADVLLTMTIRAIDYTPPIHISFGDLLSALLTADEEVRADDSRFRLRKHLLRCMGEYGIRPASGTPDGRWRPPARKLVREGSHLGGLQSDPTEMFRHIWNNRQVLGLNPNAHTRVASVRPCVRVSPDDGFQLRETVVECVQYLKITAAELPTYGLRPPPGLAPDADVVLEGGSTLVLDEYGELKYEISNPLPRWRSRTTSNRRWQDRLDYLFDRGYLTRGVNRSSQLAAFHLGRTLHTDDPSTARSQARLIAEAWM